MANACCGSVWPWQCPMQQFVGATLDLNIGATLECHLHLRGERVIALYIRISKDFNYFLIVSMQSPSLPRVSNKILE